MKQFVRALVLSVGVFVLLSSTAAANTITVISSPTITGPVAGQYTWSYAVRLEGNSVISPGDFFTILDFTGYVAGSQLAVDGWAATSSNLGTCPTDEPFAGSCTAADNAALPNLTWTRTGAPIVLAGGSLLLGDFSARSIYNLTMNGNWFSQDDDTQNNTLNEGAGGNTNVPRATAVPDGGSTAALLGSVLVGFGVLRRKISNI